MMVRVLRGISWIIYRNNIILDSDNEDEVVTAKTPGNLGNKII